MRNSNNREKSTVRVITVRETTEIVGIAINTDNNCNNYHDINNSGC